MSDAVSLYNHEREPSSRLHLHHSGGRFSVSIGVTPMVTLQNVNSALDMSNIYHCFKAFQGDAIGFVNYLIDNDVPTLVQALHTGTTPPANAQNYKHTMIA